MKFSYSYATLPQLIEHLATVSRSSLAAARKRYRLAGYPEIVARIDEAMTQIRINRLTTLLRKE